MVARIGREREVEPQMTAGHIKLEDRVTSGSVRRIEGTGRNGRDIPDDDAVGNVGFDEKLETARRRVLNGRMRMWLSENVSDDDDLKSVGV